MNYPEGNFVDHPGRVIFKFYDSENSLIAATIIEEIDFAIAFFMVHEVPDVQAFLEEIHTSLKPGSRFFVTEPKIHVKSSDFRQLRSPHPI